MNLSASIEALRHNEKQWEAFETAGHCVVLAPPGSGKTKLLTTRMAYDLVNRIPSPHGAACITLTNAAAGELQRRIDYLGTSQRSTTYVGTLHGFAWRKIILPFAKLVGRPMLAAYSIASDQQETDTFKRAIAEVMGSSADTYYVRSTVEYNRRRFADDTDWVKAGPGVKAVARRYEELLRQKELLDFEDLVILAVEFVEQHPSVRKVLTSRYPYLYVDEYQDLAPGLDRLVRAICFDRSSDTTLFAVGDPDQAVFGWTGTKPELLVELAAHPHVTPIHLNQTYRCGAEIVRIANLMRANAVPMVGNRSGGRISATRCLGGTKDQARNAVIAAQEIISCGKPLDEIVVICPTNQLCEEVAEVFRSAGIPSFLRGSEYRLTELTALVEACAAWSSLGRETSGYRLARILKSWRNILGSYWTRESDVQLTKMLLEYVTRSDHPAHKFYEHLTSNGLRHVFGQISRADETRELAKMGKALLVGKLSHLSVRGLAERARKSDRVEITTMSSSKGLEFDVVLILGLDQKRVPDFRSIGDKNKLAEDRRKFFVSVTRARDDVRIFYSGFVVWRNGRRDDAGPSMFLHEIGLL